MDPFGGLSILGGIAGLLGASSAQRAAMRRARELEAAASNYRMTMLQLASPFLQAGAGALGRIKGMTYGTLAQQAGKESEMLRGVYRNAMSGIERERARNVAASQAYWETANVGRGRGEEMRANAMAADSKAKTALEYGMQQEQYKQSSVDRYMNALGILQGAYATGVGMQSDAEKAMLGARMDATKLRASGDQAMSNMIGGLGGQMFGMGLQGMLYSQLRSSTGGVLENTGSIGGAAGQNGLNTIMSGAITRMAQAGAQPSVPAAGSLTLGVNNTGIGLGSLAGSFSNGMSGFRFNPFAPVKMGTAEQPEVQMGYSPTTFPFYPIQNPMAYIKTTQNNRGLLGQLNSGATERIGYK